MEGGAAWPLAIRLAARDDMGDIWDWRNDPQTVAASAISSTVPWRDHVLWYERVLEDRRATLYICLDRSGSKVGMSRFDASEDQTTAEVSINLNPAYRGQGLSRILLRLAIAEFRQTHPELVRLEATIRDSNIRSKRIFESLGFLPVRAERDLAAYEWLVE